MATEKDSFGTLCEDLLLNIFSRLSGWDLIKCKCLSKEWHRIITHVCVPQLSANTPISGVYFRVARVSGELLCVFSSSPQDLKDKLHHHVAYCGSSHYIDCALLKPLPDPSLIRPRFAMKLLPHPRSQDIIPGMSYASILPFKHGGPDFLDCCNGLLLFVQPPKPQFYVCNPTIRQCVPVPLPPPSVHLSSLYASLAFDPCESIHYRVIVLSITTQPQCLHIFDSESGEWMTHEVYIELPSSGKSFQLVRHSVYLKGILYRLSLLNKVICFDLDRLTIRVINNPCKTPPPPPGCIAVSNGLLSYVKREEDYVFVWLHDNPNEPDEWSLKHKISFLNIVDCVLEIKMGGVLVWLHPCGFHPTKDILFMGSASSILMYHIGSGRLQEVRSFSFRGEVSGGYFFPVFMHRNTFVTLKNWYRGTTTEINNYEEVHDNWCYVEQ